MYGTIIAQSNWTVLLGNFFSQFLDCLLLHLHVVKPHKIPVFNFPSIKSIGLNLVFNVIS